MEKIELKFQGPFSLEELKSSEKAKDVNYPGIYIWGFKKIIPNDPDFIVPYYVGESTSNIRKRIERHISDILSPASTYRRVSKSYLNEFYRDPTFPKFTNGKDENNFIVSKNESILDYFSYSNSEVFWKKIPDLNQYAIEEYNEDKKLSEELSRKICYWKDKKASDFLENSIRMGNFFIFFAPLPIKTADNKVKKYNRQELEAHECAVKFKLQGATNGKSISIKQAVKKYESIDESMDPSSMPHINNYFFIHFENSNFDKIYLKEEISESLGLKDRTVYGNEII